MRAGRPRSGPWGKVFDRGKHDPSGLKLCVSSGDVLPRRTYERFLARFGVPIRSLYGSTEDGSIAINPDPPERMQFGPLGLPLKNVTIRIRDESGRELPDNESGSIWVKCPVIPPTGYENRPELTARIFRDGYYITGDIGKKDPPAAARRRPHRQHRVHRGPQRAAGVRGLRLDQVRS